MKTKKSTGHQKNKEGTLRYFLPLAFCALLIALFITGCGYSIQGKADLPFRSIGIGKIINKTFEPQLEDKMQVALANELLRNGFVIDNTSGYRIDGSMASFELRTLSEKNGVATEYEVVIRGKFTFADPVGKVKTLRDRGVFIVSFLSGSTESLQGVIAGKEVATDKALSDFAAEIVASIMYGDLTEKTTPQPLPQ